MRIAQYRSPSSATTIITEVTQFMESDPKYYIRVSEPVEVEFVPITSHAMELLSLQARRAELAKQLAEINRRELEINNTAAIDAAYTDTMTKGAGFTRTTMVDGEIKVEHVSRDDIGLGDLL